MIVWGQARLSGWLKSRLIYFSSCPPPRSKLSEARTFRPAVLVAEAGKEPEHPSPKPHLLLSAALEQAASSQAVGGGGDKVWAGSPRTALPRLLPALPPSRVLLQLGCRSIRVGG